MVKACRWWIALTFSSFCTEAAGAVLLGRREAQRKKIREDQSAQATSAVVCGTIGSVVGSRLTYKFQPGGMAYYAVRRPLLTPKKIAALGAASAVGGALMAGLFTCNDGFLGSSMRSMGRVPLGVIDRLGESSRERQERRRKAERQEWLRMNTKPARIYKPPMR